MATARLLQPSPDRDSIFTHTHAPGEHVLSAPRTHASEHLSNTALQSHDLPSLCPLDIHVRLKSCSVMRIYHMKLVMMLLFLLAE